MNALILAAGFGTRLKPFTDTNPKALVPVEGVPMLERVIEKLQKQGFGRICVNIHHFGEKIIDFLEANPFLGEIDISDERKKLLDTGGGVVKAYRQLGSHEPLLVHNVDIISDADLKSIRYFHDKEKNDVTLLISERDSRRKLVFDKELNLKGWHDLEKDLYRPAGFRPAEGDREYAFSGIYVVGEKATEEMENLFGEDSFPVMDYFLDVRRKGKIKGYLQNKLTILDIGKPATLAQASDILKKLHSKE